MKFLAIIQETFREALARKTLVGFFIVSCLLIVITALICQADIVQRHLLSPASAHGPRQGNAFQQLAGVTVLDIVWTIISSLLMLFSILIGIFATAGFMTSMMEKGTIDLYLSKPVHRWEYILGRYTGAVLIILVEVAFLVLGLYVIVGISVSSWDPVFLNSIFYITLDFAGCFAVVTLVAVLSRSSWLAIILGISLYFAEFIIIPLAKVFDKLLGGESGFFDTISTIFLYTLPRSRDLSNDLSNSLTGQPISFAPIGVTLLVITGYLVVSSYAFSRKEF